MATIFVTILFTALFSNHEESNGLLKVNMNEPFQIKLTANHNTGYKWFADANNATAVDSVGCTFCLDYPGVIGISGKETWILKAKTRGTYTLKFICKRPWENGNAKQYKTIKLLVE